MPEACHCRSIYLYPELVQFTKFGGVLDIMNTFKKVVGVSTKVKKGTSPKKVIKVSHETDSSQEQTEEIEHLDPWSRKEPHHVQLNSLISEIQKTWLALRPRIPSFMSTENS